MPFGAGPRICIGAAFAMIEATIMLATFVRAARFEVSPDFDPQPSARMFCYPRMACRCASHCAGPIATMTLFQRREGLWEDAGMPRFNPFRSMKVALAVRNLHRSGGRLWVSLFGIAFATLLMAVQGSLLHSFTRAASQIVDAVDADLWIVGKGTPTFDYVSPDPRALCLPGPRPRGRARRRARHRGLGADPTAQWR